MQSMIQVIRKIFQFPCAVAIVVAKSVVEFIDFILDHTNTPIANLVDSVGVELIPQLGSQASILVGAALHSYLYKLYLTGILLSVPVLESSLIFGAQNISPVFSSIASSFIPALTIAVPYLVMGVGGLVVFNQLVCLKKIFVTANDNNQAQNKKEQPANSLEIMRSKPLESALIIGIRLINKIVSIPAFLNEAFRMAMGIKSAVASVFWPWRRTQEPLRRVIGDEEMKIALEAGITGDPHLSNEITQELANSTNNQPLVFSNRERATDDETNTTAENYQFIPRVIERRHSAP